MFSNFDIISRSKPRVETRGWLSRQRGFTFIELLIAIGIITILAGILIPYVMHAREMSRRTLCAAHLEQIGKALSEYARDSGGNPLPLPQTPSDPARPDGYACFTGPDDSNPFSRTSKVQPNDVTASLWLLVRGGYIADLSIFICPSSSDQADRLTNAAGQTVPANQRGNFRSPANLSYSYASPFTSSKFIFSSDSLTSEFAVLADKNPGFARNGDKVIGPARNAPPFELAKGNSPNHQHAGQNVLHPAGDVSFQPTPYCGVSSDNIYTALAAHGEHPAVDSPGYQGPDIGPAYQYDSYLVPTADDKSR